MRASLLAAALLAAAPAHALTVKGVGPDRSLRANVAALEARDWHCERSNRGDLGVVYACARAKGLSPSLGITIASTWVLYSCAVFDACDTEVAVFTEALSAARGLPAFERRTLVETGPEEQALWCARSAGGVSACVEAFGGLVHSLKLRLARFDPARFD